MTHQASNMPAQLTSLVGTRAGAVGAAQVITEDERLLTLTGAGDIGKTRLAPALACAVEAEYADGVVLAQLASLSDPTRLPEVVAVAAGIRAGTSSPAAAQ